MLLKQIAGLIEIIFTSLIKLLFLYLSSFFVTKKALRCWEGLCDKKTSQTLQISVRFLSSETRGGSWDNLLPKSKTNKPRYQFEIEMIQMFLSFSFSSERLKIALGIDSKSNVARRTLSLNLLSRRRVQRNIIPKILRIVRVVHFKLQQIITSQVLDKLDERRINLQKQTANPNDRKM